MRFRESDYAAIKKKAEQANMNFTEFVTAAAMNKPVIVISDLGDVLKEQKAIGRNINQLTTLCNMGKIVCPDLRELKEQYTDMLTALNEIRLITTSISPIPHQMVSGFGITDCWTTNI